MLEWVLGWVVLKTQTGEISYEWWLDDDFKL